MMDNSPQGIVQGCIQQQRETHMIVYYDVQYVYMYILCVYYNNIV